MMERERETPKNLHNMKIPKFPFLSSKPTSFSSLDCIIIPLSLLQDSHTTIRIIRRPDLKLSPATKPGTSHYHHHSSILRIPRLVLNSLNINITPICICILCISFFSLHYIQQVAGCSFTCRIFVGATNFLGFIIIPSIPSSSSSARHYPTQTIPCICSKRGKSKSPLA